MAGWAAYAKRRDIFKSNLAICLERQVYNSYVLPAMIYGADTWTLTKLAQHKLAAAQTKLERTMLNITCKDRNTNIWVRERTNMLSQRRPMDLACHHLETIRQENMTREPSGGETTWTYIGATQVWGRLTHTLG